MTRPSRVSRRQCLRRSAVAAGAALATGARRAWARPSDFVPAIVIGSGFGGAVAALRRVRPGIDTLVLERGRRWPIRPDGNTWVTFEQPDGRGDWLREVSGEDILGLPMVVKPADRFTGVLEVIEGDGIRAWIRFFSAIG